MEAVLFRSDHIKCEDFFQFLSTFRNQQLAKRVNLLQEEAEAAAKGKKGGRWRRETRLFSNNLLKSGIFSSCSSFSGTPHMMEERRAIELGQILQKL